MNLKDNLIAFLALAKSAGCRRLCVAYSGGIDSHVLLVQLNELNQGKASIPLDAVYINHNLQNDSDKWAEHCQQICQALDIPFKQLEVQAKPQAGESPEEKARTVRYQALAGELQTDHWLLTAQHMDDQAETLLLQLLRGSGVNGLSAMPEKRQLGEGEHHRPLLKISKQQIEQYAVEHQLKWIEDPSNQDQSIARNYLRKTVFPGLKKFWPQTTIMLDRSADWLAEAAEITADVARQDLSICQGNYHSLHITELIKFSLVRQKNLLRFWFHSLGLKRPGNEKLEVIFEQIINAREDANPQLNWQGICLRRYREHLYVLPKWKIPEKNWSHSWDALTTVYFPDGSGSLKVAEVFGRGLSMSFLEHTLTLQFRKGGEECHPEKRSQSRPLKKLFQEYAVPPWLRERWPLLYCNDQLIAVPGLFICKGFEAKGSEPGLEFSVDFISL